MLVHNAGSNLDQSDFCVGHFVGACGMGNSQQIILHEHLYLLYLAVTKCFYGHFFNCL